jgi:tyrosine-protein kinase Etk/Wzc
MSGAAGRTLEPFVTRNDSRGRGQINPLDILQVVADNLRLLILMPIVSALIALGWTYTSSPVFTAITTFITPQQQQSAAVAMLQSPTAGVGANAGTGLPPKNPADQYVSFLSSRSIQDALNERFKLTERYGLKISQQTRSALNARAAFGGGKDGLMWVTFDDTDPVFAAQVANAYVEELGYLLNRLVTIETQQRRAFFEKQLRSARESLVRAEQVLKSGALGSGAIKGSPQAVVDGLAALKAAISAQEIKVAGMRGYLAPRSSDLRQALFELAALHKQMGRAETERPANTGSENDYVAKFREFKYQETLYELIARQYEIARVDESRESSVIQVVDVALPPQVASKPKRVKMAAGAGVGMGLVLLLFCLGRAWLRTAVQDAESAAKSVKLVETFKAAVGFTRFLK